MNAPQAPYEQLGGDEKVRELVGRLYDLMDSVPEFAGIRKLHQPDLSQAREKLYLYLSGWLGGPQLYTEKFGHPMLRARHLPFAIGTPERDQWMACMSRAMQESGIDDDLRQGLYNAFFKTADWMRNRKD
ncbi:MAG: group II truncated hemoglobin [Burkholderiales bacterium]